MADCPTNHQLFLETVCNEKKIDQLPEALENLEEEVAEAVVERAERYHLRQRIYNKLTL